MKELDLAMYKIKELMKNNGIFVSEDFFLHMRWLLRDKNVSAEEAVIEMMNDIRSNKQDKIRYLLKEVETLSRLKKDMIVEEGKKHGL